ncbi:hypothetical protein PC116_g25959 [Phytophthora cactorum]|uniref:Uncharacterized protein n=1 Tax=Phytophthora cactorum TaxID=29920 RepID=A0A8T0YAX0_9STRA|nr:hypothetical protein PC113_g22262 [Phytophthora cactorum]KAG3125148.1 hypothetical protein C6341_g25899 [Phytophthora cactorum]KAG4225616.1 hypothetical protein PC116_g25959 [Phytophthora cactorum]
MLTRFALRLAGRTALRSSFCRSLATSSSTDGDAKTGRPWTDLFSTAAPTKLVKRKVAIVTGYMGTDHHGLQLNENVKTIEDDIRHAIFQACAMRESNFEDLGKIDWARSSRTDKGVHAGCIVFSGKLLIDEENKMDPVSGRVNGHKEALNASLPENIRVFSYPLLLRGECVWTLARAKLLRKPRAGVTGWALTKSCVLAPIVASQLRGDVHDDAFTHPPCSTNFTVAVKQLLAWFRGGRRCGIHAVLGLNGPSRTYR